MRKAVLQVHRHVDGEICGPIRCGHEAALDLWVDLTEERPVESCVLPSRINSYPYSCIHRYNAAKNLTKGRTGTNKPGDNAKAFEEYLKENPGECGFQWGVRY